MNYLLVLVLGAAAIAANAFEHGEGLDNPIIEFFEAPVRAFKTKVAEDVEPVSNSEPEGKSVGVAKTPNNSWFRGNGLASWLMSRNAATSTTTTTPEVVLNTPVGSNQQIQAVNSPNRRRLVRRQNVRRRGGGGGGQYVANNNWNLRRNASPNRRRINRRPIEEDAYSDEDDYDDYSNGRHYQLTYDTVPYRSMSYEDEEDDDPLSYMPIKPHKLRRGYSDHKKNVKPNSSFLQPFQDMPIQARPMRLRQNLPATKPIGTKQQHSNRKPASNSNRKPSNQNSNSKNKKKKNKNKNKPSNANNNANKVQHDPVHFIVHPQGNGQLPVLIPVNKNKKNPSQNVMNDPMDYQNYQYIPIPIQAFAQGGGFKGIPQIQVIAQHTHTFRPHHGFPTEVILGPAGYDNGYGGQYDVAENTTNKKKNNKHKGEMNSMNNQNQKIVVTNDEPLKDEGPMTAIIEEHMIEPTKQTIVVEEIMKPETTMATQTSGGEELMEVTAGGEEKTSGTEVRSVDGRQHIVVPRHIFPIFGASSLVEVANNGRFLLKTGRDLKVDDQPIESVNVGDTKEKELLDEKEPLKDTIAENETPKPELSHSIMKKEQVSIDEKPAEPAAELESANIQEEEPKPLAAEKTVSNPIPVRPEQLQDIPVVIVHDESPVKEPAHSQKSGRSVHHNAQRPLLRSEIVHEKPNGHFIVKSGVVGESRSRVHQNVAKDNDSEIQNIRITPIENSRAL